MVLLSAGAREEWGDKGEGVTSIDISSLDVSSDDADVSEWGGLSQFSGRTSEIVSQVMTRDYDLITEEVSC